MGLPSFYTGQSVHLCTSPTKEQADSRRMLHVPVLGSVASLDVAGPSSGPLAAHSRTSSPGAPAYTSQPVTDTELRKCSKWAGLASALTSEEPWRAWRTARHKTQTHELWATTLSVPLLCCVRGLPSPQHPTAAPVTPPGGPGRLQPAAAHGQGLQRGRDT